MKSLLAVHRDADAHWVGDGFPVRTLFSYQTPGLSPFLLLDYAGPHTFAPSEERRGVGEHPHRGFETVTIVYQGELEHRDSAGNHGRIGPGDVQWMTASSGVVHEEYHGERFAREGGVFEVVQLWVNLPAKDKMTAPRYQEIPDRQIPAVALGEGAGTVRVIAGAYQGAKGPAKTFTPVNVWDLRLNADRSTELIVPEGHVTLLVVLQGSVTVNDRERIEPAQFAVFERAGGRIGVQIRDDATALLLSGEPIDEPVVGRGPFVMNNEAEIRQAMLDYQSGRMGSLP